MAKGDTSQNQPFAKEVSQAAASAFASELENLDKEKRLAEIDDRKTDTALKKRYAIYFIWILVVQLIVMNVVFVAVGLEKLKFQEPSLNLYMGGTLAEVFGVVLVITKYLFSKK